MKQNSRNCRKTYILEERYSPKRTETRNIKGDVLGSKGGIVSLAMKKSSKGRGGIVRRGV